MFKGIIFVKKYLLVILILISINTFLFSEEEKEDNDDEMGKWTFSKLAILFPISISFGNEKYLYYSFGVGMRIKTFADMYIHPSISYAMILETYTTTYNGVYHSYEIEEIESISKAAFRIALEYTVYKYTALRRIGPYRYLTHLNPLVRVYGDLGPIIGLTYADGVILDAGINWREDHLTSNYSIQYNLKKNKIGFFMSFGFAF